MVTGKEINDINVNLLFQDILTKVLPLFWVTICTYLEFEMEESWSLVAIALPLHLAYSFPFFLSCLCPCPSLPAILLSFLSSPFSNQNLYSKKTYTQTFRVKVRWKCTTPPRPFSQKQKVSLKRREISELLEF